MSATYRYMIRNLNLYVTICGLFVYVGGFFLPPNLHLFTLVVSDLLFIFDYYATTEEPGRPPTVFGDGREDPTKIPYFFGIAVILLNLARAVFLQLAIFDYLLKDAYLSLFWIPRLGFTYEDVPYSEERV